MDTRRRDKRSAERQPEVRRAPALDAAPLRNRPANENDPGTSRLLARLNRRPSSGAYYVAFALSLAWIFGWSMIYLAGFAEQSRADMLRSVALLVLPIGIVFSMAYFLWRAQQLRQVSEVLMQSAMRLIRPQEIATEGLTSIAQAVRSEVDLLVGGVEHAIQRATVLEEIVHKEISAIERAFGGNEERIRGLVTGLENQRSALHQAGLVVGNESVPMLARLESNTQNLDIVINNAQSTLLKLEQGLKNSTIELTRTIEEVSSRASAAGNEMGGQTAQMERMSGAFVGELRTFSQHLQDQIQTLSIAAGALNSETANFGRNVQGMETNVVQLLKQSVDHLTGVNMEVGRSFDRASNTSIEQIKQVAAEMADAVQSSSSNITYHLKATSAEVASQIERSGIDAAQQIEQGRGLVTQGLQSVAQDYLEKIARSHSDLTGYLNHASTEIITGVDEATGRLADRLSTSSVQFLTGMDQTANHLLSQLNASGSGMTEKFRDTTNRLFNDIDQKTNAINLKLDETTSSVVGRFDQQASIINTQVAETVERLYTDIDSRTQSLGASIENNASRMFDAIAKQNVEVNGRLDETVDSVTGKLDQATNYVYSRLEQAGSGVVGQLQMTGSSIHELLVTTSGTIASHLKETSDIVSRQMQDSGIALAQNIEGSGGLVTDKLISISGEFVQRIGKAHDGIFNLMQQSSSDITSRLEDTSSSITNRVTSVTGQLTKLFDQTSSDVTERLEDTSSLIIDRITSVTGELSKQFDQTSAHVTGKLDDTSSAITSRFASATDNVAKRLDTSSTQLSNLLETTESRLGSQLEQTTTELAALFTVNSKMMNEQFDQTSNEVADQLTKAGNTMFNRIDTTARELGQRFDVATEILEKVTGDISGRLAGTGAKFAEILDTASSQMLSDLGKASEAFSDGLGHTTMQISGRFEQETGLLVGRIDKAVKEFDTAASSTNSGLEEAHRKFSKHVETASTYLTDQLSTSATSLDDRLESISMQLTGKLEMTGSRISERLEDVSGLVEKSIDKFNSEMENVLVNRKNALDGLINDANRRAQEIDAVMTSYMNLIEESLAASEARSKDISRVIAEQTSIAMDNLEQEIRKLETSSGGQITQASRVLREQHERAMASMNEMLSSTASDFQQTAQDMRITAQQVVKDIDGARSDIKRAILELPEETKTNADAMRRVVADQIAALNTLADVVKRQTGTTDFSGPSFSSSRSTREPSPGKSEGATFLAPQTGTSSALKKTMERFETRNSSPATREAGQPRKTPAVDTADSKGISREIENLTQKLNVAARDLFEVLDDGLPAALEKRFNKNEKDVYTQRLYEERGKRLQKTISTRYETDRVVRTRVDSYIRLFERLLDTVAEAPQGNKMVEGCLVSEPGKIYVMLAEACGRIDPS